MKKIVVGFVCIMLFFAGCRYIASKSLPIYTVIPQNDERAPSASVLSLLQARSIYLYNFTAFSAGTFIDEIKGWIKETVVVKEWDGYYYSKHTIAEHPELSYYIFYQKEDYSNIPYPMVWCSYFVIPISSEEVSAIQVGDPYSKFQEQYGAFPILSGNVTEFAHSDGTILFCEIDFDQAKIVDVRPGLREEFGTMIKEILEFEATLE